MDKGHTDQIVAALSDAGQRLDLFLATKIDRFSRARIQALIRSGHVLLNGSTCRAKQTIRTGDSITVSEPEPDPVVLQPESLPVPILFEDEHLAVVHKPAGMVVHPGAGVQSGTLVNALLHHVSNLSGIGGVLRRVVHRLDKETSGCLVVAKHDVAHLRLSNQFAGRKFRNSTSRCAPGDSRNWAPKLSSRLAVIRSIAKKWPSSTVADRLTPDTRSSSKQANGPWSYAKFTLVERIRFGSISIRSGTLFWATRSTEKQLANSAGRCCTPGGWDFFILWQKIGWSSKLDCQTIFCSTA
jgi:hypothetical protein